MPAYPGLPLPAALLRADLWVAEVVYIPLETELLRAARRLGCRTLDGGGMAVYQAVEAFRLFTGLGADAQRMRDVFGIARCVSRAESSRARIRILALISLAVAINYLDRAVLGIAAPAIQQEYAFSPAPMGTVFSAFSWTYFVGQVPSGVLLDRFGTRAIYALSFLGWSLVTFLHAAATGLRRSSGCASPSASRKRPVFPPTATSSRSGFRAASTAGRLAFTRRPSKGPELHEPGPVLDTEQASGGAPSLARPGASAWSRGSSSADSIGIRPIMLPCADGNWHMSRPAGEP